MSKYHEGPDGVLMPKLGHEALWLWFELSYAKYCVMPRVLMHEMPDVWQAKMAALLFEYDAAWNWDGCGFESTTVRCTRGGKLVSTPRWILDYRHPDYAQIERMRAKP